MKREHASILIAVAVAVAGPAVAADRLPVEHYVKPGAATPFSPAVRAGDTIYLSGQIGAAPDGSIPADIETQAKYALDGVAAAAKLAGAEMSDIVKCTVMLADMKQWQAFNKVYVTYFTPGRLPARSALGANGLALGAGIEVECIAYKPGP